jgi:hypothetical protein
MFKSRLEVYEGRLSTRIVQNYYHIEKSKLVGLASLPS